MVARRVTLLALSSIVFAALLPQVATGGALSSDQIGDRTVGELGEQHVLLAPRITASAGVLVGPDGRTLWARDAEMRLPMASTTKMLTALVVRDRVELDERVRISRAADMTGGSSAGLVEGSQYTVDTLLQALLVRSGNDAATALAEHVAGEVPLFVSIMNDHTAALGLKGTSFENPHGFDAPGHFSTASDLAVIARDLLRDPVLRRVTSTETMTVPGPESYVHLENSNLLLGTVEGTTGVKTGWTSGAGFSLVASAMRGGDEFIAVILRAEEDSARFREAGLLLEWGFAHYTLEQFAPAGEVIAAVRVADYLDRSVEAVTSTPAQSRVLAFDGEITRRVDLVDVVHAPVRAGDRLGTLSFVQGERLLSQVPIVAASDVGRPSLPERGWIAIVRGFNALRQ